jgi:hypothetical protein
LILPASVPLADATVAAELTRNLEDAWKPIIDADIDGPGSVALAVDAEFRNLGRYSATRRAARAVFLGSAPRVGSPNRGIDAQRVRLACALPGETVAVYGDALGRLSDRATYFYVEGGRAWFGTQPGVARLARDRAERYREQARDEVQAEIVRRLRRDDAEAGDFTGVHVAPASSADVADVGSVRLVVLAPDQPHISRSDESLALGAARDLLEHRGNAPRAYRNMLVFLAADDRRIEDLEHGVADFLAWQSIDREAEELGLDLHQAGQAHTRYIDTDRAVDLRLADSYQWTLVPQQPDPTGPVSFSALKADGQGSLGVRVSRKLVSEGSLYLGYPPVLLRLQLDGVLSPLWERGHVAVAELWDTLARYVYLPRLRDENVLLATVKQAPGSMAWEGEGFATADVFDEKGGRYLGLSAGALPAFASATTLVVRPTRAVDQLAAQNGEPNGTRTEVDQPAGGDSDSSPVRVEPVARTRFYGTAQLDSERLNRDFGRIAQEVLTHLSGLHGTAMQVTVEVVADNPDGFSDDVVRIVTENAQALRFTEHDFE